MKPIRGPLRNSIQYEWSHEYAKVFHDFKDLVTKAPIPKHIEPMGSIVVEIMEVILLLVQCFLKLLMHNYTLLHFIQERWIK